MMTFPDTWEEYEKSYGFTDNEEVYTNGARLIPSFRVKQWLDHLPSAQPNVPDTNVGELISRQAAINKLDEFNYAGHVDESFEALRKAICELPSVQPERKKGKWLWDEDTFDWEKEYICSECGCYALRKDGNQIRSNFCPNCGCRMEEGDSDE